MSLALGGSVGDDGGGRWLRGGIALPSAALMSSSGNQLVPPAGRGLVKL